MAAGFRVNDIAGRQNDGCSTIRQCVRRVLTQLLVLALDELRVIARSRRGRLLGAVYLMLNLLPLALYLWTRSRWVVTWPIDACDVAWYLQGHRLYDLILIVVLGHDLLTRGDRQGWQDGFASLPVGELTWFCGRLGGRLGALLLLLALPFVIGWGVACCWAGGLLDPLPFVSILLGRQGLSLVLVLPLTVLAGCAGSSLIGAVVVLAAGLTLTDAGLALVLEGAGRLGVPAELGGVRDLSVTWAVLGDRDGAIGDTVALVAAVLIVDHWGEDGYLSNWSGVRLRTDAGRGWPPAGLVQPYVLAVAAISWLLLLGLGPYLLRLRRRPGRLQLKIPSLPSFSRWLAEAVDQTRPTRPEGRPARVLAVSAGLLLLAMAAWLLVATAERGGRQRTLLSPRASQVAVRSWPVYLQPNRRRIELRVRDDGILHGRQVLWGTVVRRTGTADRPVPFSLAPGIEVLQITDGSGRRLTWQRGTEQLWVSGLQPGEHELSFTFQGRPRQVRRVTSMDLYHHNHGGGWILPKPLQLGGVASGLRYWSIDLEGLSWAPEPLRYTAGRTSYGGREPCRGMTTLHLRLPRRLVPTPLPGDWREETAGAERRVFWTGRVGLLPALVAGRLHRSELDQVTVVSICPATDREGLARHWLAAWDEYPPMPVRHSLVVRLFGGGALRPGFLHWSPEPSPDPDLERPAGLITLPFLLERRPLENAKVEGLHALVRGARARFRFAQLTHRLDGCRPMVVRRILWQLCSLVEEPRRAGSLSLGPIPENELRSADLTSIDENDPASFQRFQGKIRLVSLAMTALLGPAQLQDGLQRIAAGRGPLTVDGIWEELSGEREQELRWFRDQVITSCRLSAPRITQVTLEEQQRGWRVHVTINNDGDALIVVPLRLLGQELDRKEQVRVAAGERVTFSVLLDSPPDQVLLDPEGEVLRRHFKHGVSWSRWGGLQ